MPDSFDWENFWDHATTTQAAEALDDLYGEGAARTAIEWALAAEADGRARDRGFWLGVLGNLRGPLH